MSFFRLNKIFLPKSPQDELGLTLESHFSFLVSQTKLNKSGRSVRQETFLIAGDLLTGHHHLAPRTSHIDTVGGTKCVFIPGPLLLVLSSWQVIISITILELQTYLGTFHYQPGMEMNQVKFHVFV